MKTPRKVIILSSIELLHSNSNSQNERLTGALVGRYPSRLMVKFSQLRATISKRESRPIVLRRDLQQTRETAAHRFLRAKTATLGDALDRRA
jgi:hypothetical protein